MHPPQNYKIQLDESHLLVPTQQYHDRHHMKLTIAILMFFVAMVLAIPGVVWGTVTLKNGCNFSQCAFYPDQNNSCLVIAYSSSRNRNPVNATTPNNNESSSYWWCLDQSPCPQQYKNPSLCYYKPEWDRGNHPCYSFSCINPISSTVVAVCGSVFIIALCCQSFLIYLDCCSRYRHH